MRDLILLRKSTFLKIGENLHLVCARKSKLFERIYPGLYLGVGAEACGESKKFAEADRKAKELKGDWKNSWQPLLGALIRVQMKLRIGCVRIKNRLK